MENELNLTADVSDEEQNVDSTQDDSFRTPLSGIPPVLSEEHRRMSASQPVLNNKPPTGRKPYVSLSNIKQNEPYPFLKVKEDNERLQNEVYDLRGSLLDSQTRQRFAEEQLPRQVQDILDDYLNLQRYKRDNDDMTADYGNLREKHDKLSREHEKLKKRMDEQIREYEQALIEKDDENERIRQLFIGDDHFTLNTINMDMDETEVHNKTIALELNQQKILNDDYLKHITQLEGDLAICKQRLAEAEQALKGTDRDTSVSKTFILSDTEQKLTQRIDELITENNNLNHRYGVCNSTLLTYMNRLNKMEKKLATAGMSSSQLNLSMSFDVNDRRRVETVLEKMKTELLQEREKNRTLRKEVNHLMCKDASDDSIDTATEATEKSFLAEDKDKDLIMAEMDALMKDLKDRGWADATTACSELVDSMDDAPPIDLGDRSQELEEVWEQQQLQQQSTVPEAEQLSLLNTSIGHILQTSMSAAQDITYLKDNLSGFRDTLIAMFERLKSSALLFDEIRQILSNGEHNPLTDRIREMQLIWTTAASQADTISKAVDTAEKSIVGLQAHITVLEQTVLQTSFVLDHTRRMTFSNVSGLTRLVQDEPNKIIEEARLEELEAQLRAANESLSDATTSRDLTQMKVDFLEKQVRSVEFTNCKLEHEVEELKEDREKLRTARDQLQDAYELLNDDCLLIGSVRDRQEAKVAELNRELEKMAADNAELTSAVQSLTATREELCKRVVNSADAAAEATQNARYKEEELEMLTNKLEQMKETGSELKRDLDSAQLTIRTKSSEMERLRQDLEARVQHYQELLEASRQNNMDLQSQLNAYAFKAEKDTRTNSTWDPTTTSPDTSLVFKSTQPQVSTQTESSSEDLDSLQQQANKLKVDYGSLLTVYNELETALSSFLFKSGESGDFRSARDIPSAKKSCEKLKKGIENQASYVAKTKEEMDRMSEELQDRTNTSRSETNSTKTVVYHRTSVSEQYSHRLLREVMLALYKAADLAQNLKMAVHGKQKKYNFDLEVLQNDSREIRSILHDVSRYIALNDENIPQVQDVTTYITIIKALNKDNKELFDKLRDVTKKLEDLKKMSVEPNTLARIDEELRSIHGIMQKVQSCAASRRMAKDN